MGTGGRKYNRTGVSLAKSVTVSESQLSLEFGLPISKMRLKFLTHLTPFDCYKDQMGQHSQQYFVN